MGDEARVREDEGQGEGEGEGDAEGEAPPSADRPIHRGRRRNASTPA